jgi:hypothetical protein
VDWDRYKALCDRPDVLSRWLLEQTAELVSDGNLSLRLARVLEGVPLPRPDDHRGPAALDMLRPELTQDEVAACREAVSLAVIAGRTTSATRERGLGGFFEAWDEYHRWLLTHSGAHEATDCSARF